MVEGGISQTFHAAGIFEREKYTDGKSTSGDEDIGHAGRGQQGGVTVFDRSRDIVDGAIERAYHIEYRQTRT